MVCFPAMPKPFFTIGHSARPLAEFVDLLRDADIRLLIDVRTIPRSLRSPQFNADALAKSLANHQIGYECIAALGGLRGKSRDIPPELNAFWTNEGFHNYADYATTGPFQHGIVQLRELGRAQKCAIMCAKALWWRCHRRIIADYLLASGETVFHILQRGHIEEAAITPAAQLRAGGILTYPLKTTAGARA
jgi:uncharacterized protein (DUF488 family)